MADYTIIIQEDIRNILFGVPDNSQDAARRIPIRLQPDGTLRSYSMQVYLDITNRQDVRAVAEVDGTPREQLVLWETTTPGPIRWRAENLAGEACMSLYAQAAGNVVTPVALQDIGGAAGTPQPLLIVHTAWNGDTFEIEREDSEGVFWRRDFPGYVQVDPVQIPAAEGILWNPGATATELYEVSFLVVNNDAGAAPVTVSVGADLGGGGALAAPEYWMFNEVIPYPGSSGWRGPFVMAGDDDVRGVASIAGDASIHFRIKRVDLGA